MKSADVIVIGAGIAGASLAWRLSEDRRVIVLEAETGADYHTTGRSAALLTPYAGAQMIAAASLASVDLLAAPPEGFSDVPLLNPRGQLLLADEQGADRLKAYADTGVTAGRPLEWWSRDDCRGLIPHLRDQVAAGIYDPLVSDIDTSALHHGFLGGAVRRGARVFFSSPVSAMRRRGQTWIVHAGDATFEAPIVAIAAGAFSAGIGLLADGMSLPLEPRRRTLALVPWPEGYQGDRWPLVMDSPISFYGRPETTGWLVSPCDQTPFAACDAWPDDLDVATGIDRMQNWLDFPVQRVVRAWAGLRTFLPDEDLGIGFDPIVENLFWCVGQGGFGIQSAWGASAMARAVLDRQELPEFAVAAGIDETMLSPERFLEQAR